MKEMRRKDRSIDNESSLEILKNGEYGILSTVSNDNTPYGVPLSYIYMNNHVYFHCALVGHKLENISENNHVCFTVVGKTCVLPEKFSTDYESVILFGEASEVFESEKIDALRELIHKYSTEFLKEGEIYIQKAEAKTKVFRINIEQLTGKRRK